jgi:hypothetical protein
MTSSDLSQARAAALAPTCRRRPGPRRIVFTGVAGVLSLLLTVLSGHLLVTGWFDGSEGGARRFDDLAWAAIEGVILTAGLLAQLRRPERHAAGLRQSLLGLLALVVGGALTGAFDPATVVVLLLMVVLAVLHPARADVFRRPGRPDLAVLPVAIAVTGASVWWAADVLGRFSALPAGNVHVVHQDAAALVGLAIGVALTALLAAFDRRSRLPGVCGGLALLLVGVASLLFRGQADALPAAAAVAAVIGGLLLGGLILRRTAD